jgi:hypothetical protein
MTTDEEKELLDEINSKMKAVEEKIEAGEYVLRQCKLQMANLKKLLKEYKRIKNQVEYRRDYSAASDGDL